MQFIDSGTILVQFRLPAQASLPGIIRDLGRESNGARAERTERSKTFEPFQTVLERNGASLENVNLRLEEAGHRLADAYVQTRVRPQAPHQREKTYRLLTFLFRKENDAPRKPLVALFCRFASARYEQVFISATADDRSLVCIVAKTEARPALELKGTEDPEAESFGIVVSKALSKERRTIEAAPAIAAPPEERHAVQSTDRQLDRLLAAGWQVSEENDRVVTLTRMKDGKERAMTHYRPRVSARKMAATR